MRKHLNLNKVIGISLGLLLAVVSAPLYAAEQATSLLLYCGAGVRPPVDEIIKLFQEETNIKVEANYGPSTPLMTQLKLTGRGDLFLPGDDFYLQEARRQNLVEESHPVATFVPVITVAAGNPLKIKSVADLLRDDVRLGLCDRRVAAVGRISPAIFEKNQVPFAKAEKRLVLSALTAPELGQAVALGHVDAAINWQATAWQYAPRVTAVPIPSDKNVISPLAIAVTTASKNKEAAMQFIRFMTSPIGQEIFKKHHYDPPQTEAPSPTPSNSSLRETWPCMGTIACLTARDIAPQDFQQYVASAKSTLAELEEKLSAFNDQSDICRLNQAAGGAPVQIAPATRQVLELSLHYSKISEGLFDITTAPLVKAWGFERDAAPTEPLNPQRIQQLLALVGWQKLILSNDTARLTIPQASVNLGGIGKGFAVDQCLETLLREFKPKSVMLDLGGNIRCGGSDNSQTWTVGIRNPFAKDTLVGKVTLRPGMAIGTSGNYEKFYMLNGQRYSHIIDPHSGLPARGMAAVTVVSTNATDTEGLSKPFFILGPTDSQNLLATLGGRAVLFIPDQQPISLYITPEFQDIFQAEPELVSRTTLLYERGKVIS